MGLLTTFTSFLSDLSQFYWFVSGFWSALPIVVRLLIYVSFGGSLLYAIFRIFSKG
jgi:hypothetical protein